MNLEKRIKILEEKNKPKMINSWVDLVKYAISGENEKIEISEALRELTERLTTCYREK